MTDATTAEFPNGAHFVKAALQVNPFSYLKKQAKRTSFVDEESYGETLIQRCLDNDIRIIAVTDHFAIEGSLKLIRQATDHGLIVFPGFEAVTSEGIHALCLFDPTTKKQKIERCIGACGVQEHEDEKGSAEKSFAQLLDLAAGWDAVVIAAHITGRGGLLEVLEGGARQRAWTNKSLIAAALATPISAVATRGQGQMIRGTLKGYERDHPVAIIFAADVRTQTSSMTTHHGLGLRCRVPPSTVFVIASLIPAHATSPW